MACLLLLSSFSSSHSVFADHDHYGNNHNYAGNRYPGVTVYSDCGFSGKADTLKFGNYSSLKYASVGNDRISSLRVPYGMVAIIYEDNDFKGDQKRIYQDVSCVPKSWNDRISSIRVVPAGNDHAGYDDWNNGYNQHHENYGYNNSNPYYGNNQNKPGCHAYQVSAYNGVGAFRFVDNADGVIKVNNNTQSGNTCRKGNVRVELSKSQPNTTTVVEIAGRRYTFAANEQHDSYKNNWYRKYIDLYLP